MFYYKLTPASCKKIKTRYRKIVTGLPVKESVRILKEMHKFEPRSVSGQPPIIWDCAEGVNVFDKYGNMWLDWSSGVLVANSGHSRGRIKKSISDLINKSLIFSYYFPTEVRIELAKRIIAISPKGLDKVFLLTTGAEATENALKLAKTYALKKYGKEKKIILSFINAFHGRTMGAQLMGGNPKAKEWIGELDKTFIQVPFPDGFRDKNTDFHFFLKELNKNNIAPSQVAGVIMESYQGGGASFAPKEYVRRLLEWCHKSDILFIADEVQSGFGRTGRLFAFEHYGVVPDIVCCGKGITSSLPMSAVIGRKDILDLYGSGEMSSTHGGHPLSCAAALANIEILFEEDLIGNALKLGKVLTASLEILKNKYPDIIGAVHGKGLVSGLHIIRSRKNMEPDTDKAHSIVERCFRRGLLIFSPVGYGAATIKIAPPLIINKEALLEGVSVLDEAISGAGKEI